MKQRLRETGWEFRECVYVCVCWQEDRARDRYLELLEGPSE